VVQSGLLAVAAGSAGLAVAATATLPVNVPFLTWSWNSIGADDESDFVVADGELFQPSLDDAYDDFWRLSVGESPYQPGSTGDVTSTAWGTVITGAPVTLAGLTVTEQIAGFCFSPTLRVLVTLTNPGSEPVDVMVTASGNFGSDDDTTVEATSSGDQSFNASDRWLVTDGDSSDPVNTTVWFGFGSPAEPPTAASLTMDNVTVDFEVSIPAGATRHLLFFSQMSHGASEAIAAAADFDSAAALGNAGFLSGLTAGELSATLNWASLSPSTPSIPCPICGDQPNGTFPLPLEFAGSSWRWDSFCLADEGVGPLVIEDAELTSNGTDDAYDEFWALTVGGTDYVPSEDVVISSGSGSHSRLTASTVEIAGLEVTQEFIACCDDPTLAVLVTLHNPGGAEISVPLTVAGNVGSDDSTTVEATATGDATFDADDRWLVTDGDVGDPINTFMFFGPGTPQSRATSASLGGEDGDDIEVSFQATVPAGATQRYLFFSRLSESVQQATDGIAHLDSLAAGGSCGLTGEDLAGVVNWQPQVAGENIPTLGSLGLALLALAVAAAGALVVRRT
jgi:hypothetical protein